MDKDYLFAQARRYGQQHIFRWWDDLNDVGRRLLLEQVAQIDFEGLARLTRQISASLTRATQAVADLRPAPTISIPRTPDEKAHAERAKKIGLQALADGRAAVLLVAGGQATRFRFNHPKGMFPIGPVSGKSLFQLHAEKICALSRRLGRSIPWYIMTSDATDAPTRAFFQAHHYFRLPPTDVFFLKQDSLPAVDHQGRIILEAKSRIAMSPDGHGGCIPALKKSGALEDMQRRGVSVIFFFQVDNPLVNMLDPIFLGYHIEANADMSGKVVRKRDPEERVGVAGVGPVPGMKGDRFQVVEYINLSRHDMYARNPDRSLKFSAGVIGVYLLNVAFVEKVAAEYGRPPLSHHASEKSVPCLAPDGTPITPQERNGIKFESFVFDALPFAERCVMMEVRREEEFAPIKNREGEDSPPIAVAMLCDYYAGWLKRLGHALKTDEEGRVAVPVEISPLFALNEEEFQTRAARLKINGDQPVYIEEEQGF